MPTLLLHIGTHKTGTTAIQTFLEANAPTLERRGLLFPMFPARWHGVLPNRNGHFLNRAALRRMGAATDERDGRQADDCMARLAAWARERTDGTALLSDERMWFSGALHRGYWETVRALAEALGFDRTRVIVYLRRQDRFAEALWNQFVKATKKTETLAAYLAHPRTRAICDYDAGLRSLERVFGKDNLTVAVYDRAALKNGDAVDDFRERAGLPPDADYARPDAARFNPRLNNNLVELKRIVNLSPEYAKLNNAFGAAFAHAEAADDWTPPSELLDDAARAAFLNAFREGNERLAADYFGGIPPFPALGSGAAAPWRFDAGDMLRDAVLVMADQMARQEIRLRALAERLARLEAGDR